MIYTSETPFENYGNHWLEALATTAKPNYIYAARGELERYVYPIIGCIPLNQIEVLNLTEVRLLERSKGCSYYTTMRTQKLIGRILKRAFYDHLLPDNSLLKYIQTIKVHKELAKYVSYTEDEIVRIILGIQRSPLKNIYYLCLFTGLRSGEAICLKWPDINLTDHSILLNKYIIKYGSIPEPVLHNYEETSSRFRTLALPDIAYNCVLEEYKKHMNRKRIFCDSPAYNPENYIFLRFDNRPYTYSDLITETQRIKEYSGVKEFCLQGIRNQFGISCIRSGANLVAIKNYCGFSSNGSTIGYWIHANERT